MLNNFGKKTIILNKMPPFLKMAQNDIVRSIQMKNATYGAFIY